MVGVACLHSACGLLGVPGGGALLTRGALVRRAAGWIGAALLLTALPADGAAQQVVRYSGKVERVDIEEGLVVVHELGAKGASRRHEVRVPPETPIVTAARLRPWEMRGSRGWEEVRVSLVDVLAGDFVVVDSLMEGPRAVALRITIVESRPMPRRSP
jgi:hypothetical protein